MDRENMRGKCGGKIWVIYGMKDAKWKLWIVRWNQMMIMEKFNTYHEIEIDKTEKYKEIKNIKENLMY